MTMKEPFSQPDLFVNYDASYVLGALSPEDRQEFEQHLRTCDECSSAVRELAGLPGLMAQASPLPAEAEPMPPELLPSMLGVVRRSRRRRLFVTVGSVTAAFAACLALVLTLVLPEGHNAPATSPMTALGAFPIQATASLADHSWGTEISMACSYQGGRTTGDYTLVVIGRDGAVTELASWSAVPQYNAKVVVGTPLRRVDMAALEIRTRAGKSLLRLTTT